MVRGGLLDINACFRPRELGEIGNAKSPLIPMRVTESLTNYGDVSPED